MRHKKTPNHLIGTIPVIKTENEEDHQGFNRISPTNAQICRLDSPVFAPNLQNPTMSNIPIGIQQMNNSAISYQNFLIDVLRKNQMQNYINNVKSFFILNTLKQFSPQGAFQAYRWNY